MKEEEAQPGRKELEGRREEGRGGCEAGSTEDKTQCLLRGERKHFWLLSVTLFHYKQACKKSKMVV